MKFSSRKLKRNLPRNTHSNWSRPFAATFVTHGEIEFKLSIFTMNHWSGCCLIERCRTQVSSSDDRFKLTGERAPLKKRCEDASHSEALRSKSFAAAITFRASFGSAH